MSWKFILGAALAFLASPAIQGQDLGPFTTLSDVGDVSRKTLATYDRSSGIYFLSASGANLWGDRDAFGFVWKEMKGDAAIAARVRFMGKSAQEHRKAGVTFRQSLAPDSVYADVVVHGNGLTSLQYRATTGGATHEIQCAQEAPTTVRLEKRGDYMQVFTSNEDGVFSATGCLIRISMRGNFHAGLLVCAHDAQGFETARFSSVTVGLPPERRAARISAIEVLDVDSLNRRILWYSASRLEVPSYTASGDSLCFREDGQLKRLPLNGGTEPAVVGPESCETAQPVISAAQRVTHRVDGSRSQIWLEPTDGKPRRLSAGSRNDWLPRIAPDAQSFVYLSSAARVDKGKPAPGDYLLARRALPDGDERVLAQFYGGPGSLGISPWSADGKSVVFMSREPE